MQCCGGQGGEQCVDADGCLHPADPLHSTNQEEDLQNQIQG